MGKSITIQLISIQQHEMILIFQYNLFIYLFILYYDEQIKIKIRNLLKINVKNNIIIHKDLFT